MARTSWARRSSRSPGDSTIVQDELLSTSYSGRNCLSDGLLLRHRRSCGAVFGLGSLKSSCFRMRLMATEIAEFDFCIIFWLCSSGSSPLRMGSATAGWSRPAPSQSGRRRLGTDIAQPGMSDERQKSRPCGSTAFPTSLGSKTSDAERLPEARRDVTMLEIPRGPEHQDLPCVYSGSADRFWSAHVSLWQN